eukprot:567101_1
MELLPNIGSKIHATCTYQISHSMIGSSTRGARFAIQPIAIWRANLIKTYLSSTFYVIFLFISLTITHTVFSALSHGSTIDTNSYLLSNVTNTKELSIERIQHVINEYVNTLASYDYDTFNGDIHISNIVFHSLSYDYMYAALNNKSILFYGDSLCRNWFSFVVYSFYNHYTNNTANRPALTSLLNTNSNSLVIPHHSYREIYDDPTANRGRNIAHHSVYGDITSKSFERSHSELLYMEYSLSKPKPLSLSYYSGAFQFATQSLLNKRDGFQFDVIFANLAVLHMLHLIPSRPFEAHAIKQILNLELHLDKMIEVVGAVNVSKCIILRPPNSICKSRYENDWVKWSNLYEDRVPWMNRTELMETEIIRRCLKRNYIEMDKRYTYPFNNITNTTILHGIDLCTKYTLTQIGVNRINHRMKQYVEHKQSMVFREYNGLKLIYYDQNQLSKRQCNKTVDGRHYNELLPVQTVAVFNIIDKWC